MEESKILAADIGDVTVIRIVGYGDHTISPELKEYIDAVLSSKRKIILDLKDCKYMDSTFMGTLVWIFFKMNKVRQSVFNLVNVSNKNIKRLNTLGIDKFLSLSEKGFASLTENFENMRRIKRSRIHSDKREKAKFILEAHNKLCELDRRNLIKFKSVTDLLRKDIEGKG